MFNMSNYMSLKGSIQNFELVGALKQRCGTALIRPIQNRVEKPAARASQPYPAFFYSLG